MMSHAIDLDGSTSASAKESLLAKHLKMALPSVPFSINPPAVIERPDPKAASARPQTLRPALVRKNAFEFKVSTDLEKYMMTGVAQPVVNGKDVTFSRLLFVQ